MGPFVLCDFVGIDTLYRISEIMFDEYREERYAPPPLLKRIAAMGPIREEDGSGILRLVGRATDSSSHLRGGGAPASVGSRPPPLLGRGPTFIGEGPLSSEQARDALVHKACRAF